MANILSGKVTTGVSGIGEFAAQIKAKRLRALAISALLCPRTRRARTSASASESSGGGAAGSRRNAA